MSERDPVAFTSPILDGIPQRSNAKNTQTQTCSEWGGPPCFAVEMAHRPAFAVDCAIYVAHCQTSVTAIGIGLRIAACCATPVLVYRIAGWYDACNSKAA